MSRIKVAKNRSASLANEKKEWPAVIYFWIVGLAFVSYIVARIVLDGSPHPYHWLSAVVGGLAGIPIGWLWYRWRGD
ncbi:MAG: hypothetical protein AB1750_01440, partial [Chloroflexota bacterium]